MLTSGWCQLLLNNPHDRVRSNVLTNKETRSTLAQCSFQVLKMCFKMVLSLNGITLTAEEAGERSYRTGSL
jgi:hypothetical protein